MQSGAAVIPGKIVPAQFSWTSALGWGGLGGRCLGSRWLASGEPTLPIAAEARGYSSEIPWKGKASHGTTATLFLRDVLLVGGGLAPSHAQPEGMEKKSSVIS